MKCIWDSHTFILLPPMGNLVNHLQRDNQTETFNVIITPQMETAYKITLQTVGICSTLLSIIIIFLIIFRTPSKVSTRLQFDMVGLQVWFLMKIGVIFQNIPLDLFSTFRCSHLLPVYSKIDASLLRRILHGGFMRSHQFPCTICTITIFGMHIRKIYRFSRWAYFLRL